MVNNDNWKSIGIISIIILILIYFLDNYLTKTEKILYERLELSVIKDMTDTAKNMEVSFETHMEDRIDTSYFQYLKDKSELRVNLEQQMNLFLSSKIRYFYLIYKDKNNKFRFLLDASKEDKARFNQKLDIEDSTYYSIYEQKKAVAIKQNNIESLSITFLYPLSKDGDVEALLVFDFSSVFENELKKIMEPLKTMFILMYIIVGIFLVLTIIQTFFYYKARKRSYIDELTGACNRQYLRYFLDKYDLDDYQILMIDFDYFKKINDNYGHGVGDGVLIFGTELIESCIKGNDQLFRYGGEEFLVLVDKKNDVEITAESIRKTIHNTAYVDKDIDINVSVSIGVNPFPSRTRNTSEAINIADSMLYKAKMQGRNKVVLYEEGMEVDIEEIHANSHNIHHVSEALAENRVACHFHKIVNAKNEVYKYEALVRYINVEGEVVYPNHFLSDITHTKVYLNLTKRVIDICMEKIKEQSVHVSINLNVNDLLNPALVDYLIEAVEQLNTEEQYLTIEILENEEIKNIDGLRDVIEKLHEYGIKFAMDDFGSGYANFNYLVELKIDYVKIDGSLVEKAVKSKKSKNIVKSIIDLAHTMDMKTIVEYVSSKEVYDVMIDLKSDYFQGYYIAKPQFEIK